MMHARPLLALVIAVGSLAAPVGRANACEPAATVTGTPELVTGLRRHLLLNGLEPEGTGDCPAIRVAIALEPGGALVVRLHDTGGRAAHRTVASLETAAAVIASWSRAATFDELVLAPPAAHEDRRPPPASPEPPLVRGGVSLAAETAIDSHDRRWIGGVLSACVRIGGGCFGGLARYGTARVRSFGDPRLPILVGGDGYDALAAASWPRAVGAWLVAPAIAAGYGRVGFDWDYQVASRYRTTAHGVRAAARLSVARMLGRGFAVELGAAVDAMPAHYMRYDVAGPPEQGFAYNTTFRASIGLRHAGE